MAYLRYRSPRQKMTFHSRKESLECVSGVDVAFLPIYGWPYLEEGTITNDMITVCGADVKFGTSHPELGGNHLSQVCGFDVFSVGSFPVEYSWVDTWGLRRVATRTVNVRQWCAAPEFVCIVDDTICSVGGGFCPGDPVLAEDDAAPPEDTPALLLLNMVPGVVGAEAGGVLRSSTRPTLNLLLIRASV